MGNRQLEKALFKSLMLLVFLQNSCCFSLRFLARTNQHVEVSVVSNLLQPEATTQYFNFPPTTIYGLRQVAEESACPLVEECGQPALTLAVPVKTPSYVSALNSVTSHVRYASNVFYFRFIPCFHLITKKIEFSFAVAALSDTT